MLLDSNIIIYATQPEHVALRQFIETHTPAVSVISYIEVLGYHKLTAEDRQFLEQFFQSAERLPLSETVVQWESSCDSGGRRVLGIPSLRARP